MSLVYIRTGKLDDPYGTGVAVDVRETSGWIAFDVSSLGYLGEIIDEAEYNLWLERIKNPDMVTYFPGVFKNVGVVNRAVYEGIQARHVQARLNAQTVTAAQAHAWLVENDLDDDVELVITNARKANRGTAAHKQGKRLKNLYDHAESWSYGCRLCTELLKRAGIDKDKFFEEAAKL